MVCPADAIWAVIHFCLRVASARHDMYGTLFRFSSSFNFFLLSAWQVFSNQDFGVEQFFWADDFRADEPSPKNNNNNALPKLVNDF